MEIVPLVSNVKRYIMAQNNLPKEKSDLERYLRQNAMLPEMARLGNNGWCEYVYKNLMCKSSMGIAFAHRVKKNKPQFPSFKKDRDGYIKEYLIYAYLCTRHHRELENGPPDVMYFEITEMYQNREGIYIEYGII